MMNNVNNIISNQECSIKKALEKIDFGGKGILLIVDVNHKLIGTVTDGDIRRALIKGVPLDEKLSIIMNKKPIFAYKNNSLDDIKQIMIKKAIKDLPIVDANKKIIDIVSIRDVLLPYGKENIVMIMAGGLGSRLKELTKEIPKPMLSVGNNPILEHIINNFKKQGYNKFLISVNYKSEVIENYFQDGYAYGIKIEYIKEKQRLGTAGGIKLAESYLKKPFFITNGDIISNLNVEYMMDFHVENNFDITIGTKKHKTSIPYGVIETQENKVKQINEKPNIEYLINAGVYCINPNIIELIPMNEYFEITDLINICIKKGFKIGSYEIKEYWMDIGRLEDYQKANKDVLIKTSNEYLEEKNA